MPDEKAYKLDNGKEISCLEVVRSLPGKRQVFLGEYCGKRVFAKLYLDPKRGERHWRRELEGLNAFTGCAIATAEVLYAGKTEEQALPIIILAQLQGVVSVKQAWAEADAEAKEQILRRMVALLARHHQAGLCQTDLHLDNFLLSEQEIFSLDGAGVKLHAAGVDQDSRLENLGLLIAQLTPEWESRVQDIYDIYAAESGWQQGPGSGALLERVRDARERRWKEFRGKLFRSCTAFSYTSHQDGFQVVASEYVSPEMSELLRNPDASFPGAEHALKNGNTCTVWATAVNGRDLVIKRYNVKGFWHGLKTRLLGGRGGCSWVNGHRLLFYAIPTPRPIALLKRRVGLLCSKAYLLTEQVQAVTARDWFYDAAVASDDKVIMAGKIARMLRGLQQQQISHGDLKATNILISGGEAMLIDLDAMRQHTNPAKFNQSWAKDIQRFLQNWHDDKELLELFTNSLKSNGIDFTG